MKKKEYWNIIEVDLKNRKNRNEKLLEYLETQLINDDG